MSSVDLVAMEVTGVDLTGLNVTYIFIYICIYMYICTHIFT